MNVRVLIETKLESVSAHSPSQHYCTFFLLSLCPPAVPRRSWRITGGAGRCCLQAYTWATSNCVHLWSKSEHWCPRNSPTSSVTPKFGTTATCPGRDYVPQNNNNDTCDVDWCTDCSIPLSVCFDMCVAIERSGSGCRLSALWMSRWKWTMRYRVLHIASYRTCAAPLRS